jgi:colicin import membrane protein
MLDMNDVTQLMESMGISTQHRLVLKATFTGWKKSPGAAFEALASAKVAHAQHMAPLQLCDVRLQAAAADKALQQKAEKEAAAAKKKQEEAAAAQKKAQEEAAAAQKKALEEAAAAKKKQEEAAAAQKKAQEDAAAAQKKALEEAAAAKKKQDEAAAAQALAQRKVRFVPHAVAFLPRVAHACSQAAAAASIKGKPDINQAARSGDIKLVQDHLTADASCVGCRDSCEISW